MDFLKAIYNEFTGFWGLGSLTDIIRSGHYDQLLTWQGITAVWVR